MRAATVKKQSKEEKSKQEKLAELQAEVNQEMGERADICAREIQMLLQKHNCTIDVAMLVTTQGNAPQMQITPHPPKQKG